MQAETRNVAACVRRICIATLVVCALTPARGEAGEIDTEHLFGFTIGTDVGSVGEREIEATTTARLAKRSGRYNAISQTLSAEFVPMENFRTEFGGAVVSHDIAGVSGFEDRRQIAFGGFFADLRYRLLDRANSPFGLAVGAEPRWGRIEDGSGARTSNYSVDFVVTADREIVADRIVAAVNLLYQPETARSKVTGTWSQESTAGVATALMARLQSGVFLGAEARYLRRYDGAGLDTLAGQAFFLGPTLYLKISKQAWMAAAWSAQIAGRSATATGPLDFVNFERHQVRFLFGFNF